MDRKSAEAEHIDGKDEIATAPTLDRRSCLKLAGAMVAATTATGGATGRARAASNGFGEGGYGEGGYGGSSDTSVAVSTKSAKNITDSSATLNGSLDDLGGASSVDCNFEWRESGASSWNATDALTLDVTGSFSEDIVGLSSSTDYEFRAIAKASDGDTDTGITNTFTTTSSDHTPTIDNYIVTESGSPNPHAEITAEWDVGDIDGDLARVDIEVYDNRDVLRDSHTHSVNGSDAAGTDTFKIKHVRNETLDVVLSVTDTAENSATRSEEVTE